MGSAGFYPVTHVLFDMDGLLLDTEKLYNVAFQSLCEKYESIIGPDLQRRIMGKTALAVANILVEECSLPITAAQFVKATESEYRKVFRNVKYMPGAEKLVRHFHSHHVPQAVATSSRRSTIPLKIAGKEEVFGLFDHILVASDDPEVLYGKPHPDTFLIAAQRFANPPTDMRNVLVFEDSVAGVQAGIAAGMQVVWIPDLDLVDPKSEPVTLVLPSLTHFDPRVFQLPGL